MEKFQSYQRIKENPIATFIYITRVTFCLLVNTFNDIHTRKLSVKLDETSSNMKACMWVLSYRVVLSICDLMRLLTWSWVFIVSRTHRVWRLDCWLRCHCDHFDFKQYYRTEIRWRCNWKLLNYQMNFVVNDILLNVKNALGSNLHFNKIHFNSFFYFDCFIFDLMA